MSDHATAEARIGAALNWLQHKIRFFGIEPGSNSHLPRNANFTTSNGFYRQEGESPSEVTVDLAEISNPDALYQADSASSVNGF